MRGDVNRATEAFIWREVSLLVNLFENKEA